MDKNFGKVQNLKYISLKMFYQHRFLMEAHDKTGFKNSIFLDGINQFIKVNKKIEDEKFDISHFSFFIGFITFEHHNFFLFAEYVKYMIKIKKCILYQVVNVQHICTQPNIPQDLQNRLKEYLKIFTQGFFFSYDPIEKFITSGFDHIQNFSVNFDLTNLLQNNNILREWYIPLYQGCLGFRQLVFDQTKINYIIFSKYGFKNSNLIEITSIIEIEGKDNLWFYTLFVTTDLYGTLIQQIQNFTQNKKLLVVNTLNKFDNATYNQIQQFQKVYEQISADSKNFKYQYLRYRDKDLITFKQKNKYYNCWGVYRQMIIYYKDNSFIEQYNQGLYFMIQTQDGINKTALLGIMEILFEAFKIRLNELNFIQESKSKPFNFRSFYEKIMFNFAEFTDEIFKHFSLNFHFETEQIDDKKNYLQLEKTKEKSKSIIKNSCFFYQNKPEFLQSFNKKILFKEKIIQEKDVSILILTYNIAGINPINFKEKIEMLLNFINAFDVDLIVIGFQELMEMKITFKNLKKMMNSQNSIEIWRQIFYENIPKYKQIYEYNLLGLQNFILVNKKSEINFKVIDTDECKLGVMKMANKGAIKILIKAEDTLIEFSNCHLAAGYGYEAIENRSKMLKDILDQRQKYIFVNDVEYSFISGDTNFKILRNRDDFMEQYTYKKNCFDIFYKFDEFIYNNKRIESFQNYKEEFPDFPPTFKYIKQSQHFHETKTPAWTDRIFYYAKNDKIKINQYKTYPIILSDHLPVFLECKIKAQKKIYEKIQIKFLKLKNF